MDNNKNQGIAAVLSFLLIGLGQIYNGQISKGLTLMFLSTISLACLIGGAVITGYWFIKLGCYTLSILYLGISLIVVGIMAIAIIGVYNVYDAYNNAKNS